MVINLLNRKQAAEYMGISVSALDRLRAMGELTAIQGVPNGRVLYREEELINFSHDIAKGRPSCVKNLPLPIVRLVLQGGGFKWRG